MMLASVGMWAATTFKLTQVSSVESGAKYVFVQDGHAMGATITTISSSNALQTVADYKTTGLTGSEAYVWTLVTKTGGFWMQNVSITETKKYLNNGNTSDLSFSSSSPSPTIWTFDFTNPDAVLIKNKSNFRCLGYTSATSYAYKAYSSNLDDYPHAIKVYKLEEESNGGSDAPGEGPGGNTGDDPIGPAQPTTASDSITIWSENFDSVPFEGSASQSDLTKITSATFEVTVAGSGNCRAMTDDKNGGAYFYLTPKNSGSNACVLSVTINDLKSCYGNMTITLKTTAKDDSKLFVVGSSTAGVTVTKGVSTKIWTVSVPKGTTSLTLTFTNSGSSAFQLDDIVLKCAGATCPVSSAEYATLSSPFALDLDNMTKGYTAYVATAVNGETVTIESVSGIVPANTGLIIKGAEGTCTIPAATETATFNRTNLLQAVTEDNTVITAGNYVLGTDEGEVKFLRVESVTPTLDAGKAYLAVPSANARALRFVFGVKTGIAEVNAMGASNGVIYNIAGQRVNGSAKGIVIMNGKKFVK